MVKRTEMQKRLRLFFRIDFYSCTLITLQMPKAIDSYSPDEMLQSAPLISTHSQSRRGRSASWFGFHEHVMAADNGHDHTCSKKIPVRKFQAQWERVGYESTNMELMTDLPIVNFMFSLFHKLISIISPQLRRRSQRYSWDCRSQDDLHENL